MSIRDSRRVVVRAAAARLHRFNQRHPWSHNDHFHAWILRHLPRARGRALDVGCGRGELIMRLADHFDAVEGTDVDAAMRQAAAERCADVDHVTVIGTELAHLEGRYDLITMVAVLHHLDPTSALVEVRRLLAPEGRLLVVGLAPPVSPLDQVWDLASAVANPVMGMIKHPSPTSEATDGPPFPVRDPEVSLDQLRDLSGSVLPGVRLRRRIFFRHTLTWTAPACSSSSGADAG